MGISTRPLKTGGGHKFSSLIQYEGDDFHTAEVVFSGTVQAKASRDVSAEGGLMAVESGGVYVSAVSDLTLWLLLRHRSILNSSVRTAGSLVLVHLR